MFGTSIVTALTAVAVAGGGGIAPATVASSAAYTRPACNSFRSYEEGDVPAHTRTGLDCYLGPGQENKQVYTLQVALKYCHKYGIKLDGHYGPGTTAVVKDFQARNRLEPDGNAGPKTMSRILWAGRHHSCFMVPR